jgi:hypothetical protein
VSELDVLRRAREALRTDWWAGYVRLSSGGVLGGQRRPGSVGEGRTCLVQHLGEAAGGDLRVYEALALRVAARVGGSDAADIPPWNDSHSYEEVCGLVDDVIAQLEEHEFGEPLSVDVYEPALD